MAKYLGATPFWELLPSFIAADPTIRDCADALGDLLDAATRAIPATLIYARLAVSGQSQKSGQPSLIPPLSRLAALAGGLAPLPREIVDLLAWQLHVEGYGSAADDAARLEMVAKSVALHRKRGTKWAVEEGLAATFQFPCRVREWFEYGGDPYFCRVRCEVGGVEIDARTMADVVRVINEHKNVRSWLESIDTRETSEPMRGFYALSASICTRTTLTFYAPPPETEELRVWPTLAIRTFTREVRRVGL